MLQHDRLLRSLIALALTAAIAGCGGVAPKGSAESGGGPGVSAPATDADNNAALSNPNQSVSSDGKVTTPPAPEQAIEPSGSGIAPGGQLAGGAGSPGNPGSDHENSGSVPANPGPHTVPPSPPTTPTAPPPAPPAAAPPTTGALSFSTLGRGGNSGVAARYAVLITDADAWKNHWAKHSAIMSPAPAAPAIDFSQQSVLAVYMGEQRSGGYSVEVTGVQQQNGKLMVTVKQTRPGPGSMTTMALTQPYHILSIPKMPAGTTVEVKWQ